MSPMVRELRSSTAQFLGTLPSGVAVPLVNAPGRFCILDIRGADESRTDRWVRARPGVDLIVLSCSVQLETLRSLVAQLCPMEVIVADREDAVLILRALLSHTSHGGAQVRAARIIARVVDGFSLIVAGEFLAGLFTDCSMTGVSRALGLHRGTVSNRLVNSGGPHARRLGQLAIAVGALCAIVTDAITVSDFALVSGSRSPERLLRLMRRFGLSSRLGRKVWVTGGQHAFDRYVTVALERSNWRSWPRVNGTTSRPAGPTGRTVTLDC